jgi:hypothetical protein
LRKISKIATKKRSTQEDLAEAIIEGNAIKIEEVIDVYIALNGPRYDENKAAYERNVE